MADSIEKKILAAFETLIGSLTFVKTVNYKRIRINLADFEPHEIPGVQIYDNGQVFEHNLPNIDGGWSIIVELFQKTNPDSSHDVDLLLDRKFEIETKIGNNNRLGITPVATDGQVKHVKYVGATTNLYMLDGMSVAFLEFQVLFRKPYVSVC